MRKTLNKVKSFAALQEVPLTCVKPGGFIKEFLLRQKSGLTGNFSKQGYPFNTVMWAGKIYDVGFRDFEYNGRRIPVEPINAWWPYEQTGYLLDGIIRLGLLLDDDEFKKLFEQNLKYLLDHPDKNGHLACKVYDHTSEWPMAVFFKSVIAYCGATGDQSVIDAFHRHYASMSVSDLADSFRHIMNLEGVLTVYAWTGDQALLEKAQAAYKRHCELNEVKERYEDELWFKKIASGDRLVMHGVSASESLKLPVMLYNATGDRRWLEPAKHFLDRIFADHSQPTGMPSANEYLSGHDPLQGYETCVITDLTWTMGYFIMADANVEYADRVEKIIYNALGGSITKDFSGLQYLSAVNQVVASPFSNNSHFLRGRSAWRQYRPNHFPECCPGNVHRTMPNFVARMWMQDGDGAPVAVFFGPGSLDWEYNGIPLKIESITEYPFDETVKFKFSVDKSTDMPFSFRVPGWCNGAELYLNGKKVDMNLTAGTFARISREWSNGDELELRLPMTLALKRDRQWQWLERGPLVFAYDVPHEEIKESEDKFAPRTFNPTGNWNYALDLTPETLGEVKVIKRSGGYPYESPALELEVPVRRISNYSELDCTRYTPQVPLFFKVDPAREWIKLVPFATTITRITAFPVPEERSMIPVISVTAAGPFPYNRRIPLAEQVFEPESWQDYEFIDKTRSYVLPSEGEYYDLIRHFKASHNVLGYMMFRIWADEPGPATLAVGVSDGCIGWLNGEKVLEIEPITSGEFMEPFWFDVTLNKGYNFLKLKVCDWNTPDQYRESWGAKVTVFRRK